MKMKSLSHIFVDVENSAGLEVNNLEVFMANCNTKFSQKIALNLLCGQIYFIVGSQ